MMKGATPKMTEYKKYFITQGRGGYSNCLDRGQGYTLPNCVAYAWSNFYFLHGQRKDKASWAKRPRGDANTIYEACKKNGSGFIVRKAVTENSIACYNVGANGHVVYIFYQQPDGKWLCGESNYSGTLKNGKFIRYIVCDNPAVLYKGYQGCVYDFT